MTRLPWATRAGERDVVAGVHDAEERPTATGDDGHDVHHDLVDQAEPQCLPADLTSSDVDDPVAAELAWLLDRGFDSVGDERERCGVRMLPIRRRSWVTTKT
ncbi:hypothetical protein ACFPJ1_02595 [Kribbella qitaiheensis]|uniref:hypothetical protein n=1 Tax=Kribbella qitaiheensis TaxID=1544730 RepID=UPI00360A65CF